MLHYFSQRTPQDPYTLENLRPCSSDFKNLRKCVRTLLLSSSSWFCIPISQSSFSSCSFCKSRRIFIIWSCKQKDTSCFHTFDKCSTCAHSLISISQAEVWFSNILILIMIYKIWFFAPLHKDDWSNLINSQSWSTKGRNPKKWGGKHDICICVGPPPHTPFFKTSFSPICFLLQSNIYETDSKFGPNQ